MRCVYTRPPSLDPLPRAYCHLVIGRRAVPALIDTGADTTVLPEIHARLLGLPFQPAPSAIGVGGPVTAFIAVSAVVVDIDAPVRHGRGIRWEHVGRHKIRPLVIPGPARMPALIGRRDVLVAYRFTLIERDQVFELTRVV